MDKRCFKGVVLAGLLFLIAPAQGFGYLRMKQKAADRGSEILGQLVRAHPEYQGEHVSILYGRAKADPEQALQIGRSAAENYGYTKIPQFQMEMIQKCGIISGILTVVAMILLILQLLSWRKERAQRELLLFEQADSLHQLRQDNEYLHDQMKQEAMDTKSLVTDLSHQLKTPLAALKMCYEIAETSVFTEEERQALSLLAKMEISAKTGDVITLAYQPQESDGLGYEETKDFRITGIISEPEGMEDGRTAYAALVSKAFMEQVQPESSRRYRAMIELTGVSGMSTSTIEALYKGLAEEVGIPEVNIGENRDFLMASYTDPALMSGIVGVLIIVALAGIMTLYSIYYISLIYNVQGFGKMKALGATKRQIRQIVFREGMMVAGIVMPIGLLVASFVSQGAMWYLIDQFAPNDVLGTVIARIYDADSFQILNPWLYLMTVVVTEITKMKSLYIELTDLKDGEHNWLTSVTGVPEKYEQRLKDSVIEGNYDAKEFKSGDKIVMSKWMNNWAPDWKIGDEITILIENGDEKVEKRMTISWKMPINRSESSLMNQSFWK